MCNHKHGLFQVCNCKYLTRMMMMIIIKIITAYLSCTLRLYYVTLCYSTLLLLLLALIGTLYRRWALSWWLLWLWLTVHRFQSHPTLLWLWLTVHRFQSHDITVTVTDCSPVPVTPNITVTVTDCSPVPVTPTITVTVTDFTGSSHTQYYCDWLFTGSSHTRHYCDYDWLFTSSSHTRPSPMFQTSPCRNTW